MTEADDRLALIDLDGTLADYDKAMRERMVAIQAPCEKPYVGRYEDDIEPPYMEARRKLIQRQTGFWRNLERIPLGFEIIDELRGIGFPLHVLTTGPATTPSAWSEKVDGSREELPDALVTVTSDKSLVYGRVLVDDWPAYFTKWLIVRPRGLVVCVAHPWNIDFAKGGPKEHPSVLRYDGTNRTELRALLKRAHARKSGESF